MSVKEKYLEVKKESEIKMDQIMKMVDDVAKVMAEKVCDLGKEATTGDVKDIIESKDFTKEEKMAFLAAYMDSHDKDGCIIAISK